jgi:CheY-like chemotaxis protein
MAEAPSKRARVLGVDDEQIMRELLRLHFSTNGYEVQLELAS